MGLARNPEVSSIRAASDAKCPAWCQQEHLGRIQDPQGFHHDSGVSELALEFAEAADQPMDIYVNVSQHVQTGTAGEPALVEVQNALRTILLMTPADCLRLSRALLENAGVAVGEPVVVRVQPHVSFSVRPDV